MFANKAQEKKFEQEERDRQIPDKLFEIAMACSFDAFMITTAEQGFPIVFVNKAFTEITGYSQHECMGRNPSYRAQRRIELSWIVYVRIYAVAPLSKVRRLTIVRMAENLSWNGRSSATPTTKAESATTLPSKEM